jgi:hypothetical protein
MITHQTEHRLNTLTALRSATTGGINLLHAATAIGNGLLEFFVGQRVANADVHDAGPISNSAAHSPELECAPDANASQYVCYDAGAEQVCVLVMTAR